MSNTGSLSAGIGLISSNSAGDVIEVFTPVRSRLQAAEFELITAATELHPDRSGYEALTHKQAPECDFRAAGLTDWAKLLEQADIGQWLVCLRLIRHHQRTFLKLPQAAFAFSHRLCKPRAKSDGLFAPLKNLAWTNEGPVDLGICRLAVSAPDSAANR